MGAINRSKLAIARTFAVFALVALSACTTPSGTFCDLASGLAEEKGRPSQAEIAAMSEDRRARVLAFYLRGERLCGWKP